MTLSVLIPTLTERRDQFATLKSRLEMLSTLYRDEVEILSLEDNRDRSTGLKRNDLVDMAKGKFSVFIDDDDDVPDYYFDSIFRALRNNPETDCIGFKGLIMWNDNIGRPHTEVFKHSVGQPYSKNKVGGMYLRPPNHLNPMRTEYFRQVRFPDLTLAEDFDFCLKLAEKKLIQHETFLPVVMYHYHFNNRKKEVSSQN